MGRIATILRYQWTAYTRRAFRVGNPNRGSTGVLILAVGLFLYRYLQLLPKVAAEAAAGTTQRLELLLAGMLLLWMFPLLGESRFRLNSRALRHFPLTPGELFGIKVISSLMPPSVWVLAAGSLAICYTVAFAPNPKLGATAVILLMIMSLFVGHTLAHLLSIASWRKFIYFVAGGGLLAAGFYFLTNVGAPLTGLLSLSSLLPGRLVVSAAMSPEPLRAVAALGLLCATAGGLAIWSFRHSLHAQRKPLSSRMRVRWPSIFPGRFGGLIKKDVRYFSRLLDFYLGLLVAVWAAFYLIYTEDPSPNVFRIALIGVLLFNLSAAFNYFGFESPSGFDRYTLLPMSGREIIVNKNLAFALMVAAALCPVILLASWRFGITEGALGIVEVALLALAYMVWGNLMSVRQPFKMQFFRFSSGGSPVEMLVGAVFGSLPGAFLAYLLYQRDSGAAWKIILMLLTYGPLYWVSVARAATSLERKREELRRYLV
jgi:hypothetical protein